MQQQQQFTLLGFQFRQTIANRSTTFLAKKIFRGCLLNTQPLGRKLVEGVDEVQAPMTVQHAKCLIPGGRDNPPGKRPRFADPIDVLQQSQPDDLTDVVKVVVCNRYLPATCRTSGPKRSTRASQAS